MRRIVLVQFYVLFIVMIYCFLAFAFVCIYVYVLDFVLALRSWVDVEPPEEYQELPSETFEQHQENWEEGKYNMNIPITFKYNFILHFNSVRL